MKVDVSVLNYGKGKFEHRGSIKLVSGKAVPEAAVKNLLVPSIPDPDDPDVWVTPKQGERYLQLLPPELSQTYINAVLDPEQGGE